MRALSMKLDSRSLETIKISPIFIFLGIFAVYLILRGWAWKNTVLLEDTDSLSYLKTINLFLTFDLQEIIDMNPDDTPFYPFFGALFSLPGWSVETGARLCSLFFSVVLFLAIWGLGRQIAKPLEIALGLVILSFNPVLISLSFGVLTEPSYIGTIYLGIWLFWAQYKDPKLWKGVLLGIIFGLAFLNRIEGLLYLVAIPFLQGIYIWLEQKQYGLKRLVGWSLVFIISFSLMAGPQIWRVSHKMGILAINGRQIWSVVLNNPDGKSRNEKVFGLEFSPGQYNIEYIKSHPEVLAQFESRPDPLTYLRTVMKNFNILYQERLGELIGPFGIIFFAFGIFSLYQSGHRFELLLILVFIGFNLMGPLLHNVVMRHVIIIAPIIFLTAGIGIVYLSRSLLAGYASYAWAKYILPLIFLLVLIGVWVFPLRTTFRPRNYNREYSPAELEAPITIVQEIATSELGRPPVISAQRAYLAYFAGGRQVYAPYANYEGLVRYCELNEVDFLYLKHSRVKEYPFFETFLQDSSPPDFVLLYSDVDAYGGKIELYRFRRQGDGLSLEAN